jgi:hypothetical protein
MAGPDARRLTGALLVFASAGLLASSIYRASTAPFTIDESLSFAIFTWDPSWGAKANNHVLNTALMRLCSRLFGNSELSLRLPNVVAHGMYLICALALLRRMRDTALQVAGFVLLNLNVFLLDFFSLARGYGLALAFELLSLYWLVRGYEETTQSGLGKCPYLSISAASLAVLANFSFLDYYLPLLLVWGYWGLTVPPWRRFTRGQVAGAAMLVLGSAAFLAVVLLKVVRLRRLGQLYVGGQSGLVDDTVLSLVRASLYSATRSQTTLPVIGGVIVASFWLLLPVGFWQLFWRRRNSVFGALVLILASAAALPVFQHRLLHTVYPIERAALYYVPLYVLALLFGLWSLEQLSGRHRLRIVPALLAGTIAVIVSWHFARRFDLHGSYTWWHDRHNTDALRIISQDHDRHFGRRAVKLRASSIMLPSLTFYRVTRNYTWLLPLNREPITRSDADYIYAFEHDLDSLPVDRDVVLAYYPDIDTVLLRINRAPDPGAVAGSRPDRQMIPPRRQHERDRVSSR